MIYCRTGNSFVPMVCSLQENQNTHWKPKWLFKSNVWLITHLRSLQLGLNVSRVSGLTESILIGNSQSVLLSKNLVKQCPAREGPPSTPTNGSAVLTNRGTTFGPCIDRFSNTFQCNGEVGIRTESRSLPCTQGLCSKYSIIFNPSQPIQSQFLRIQFSSNVNLVTFP